MCFCCLLIFFKINFFEKFFKKYHESVKQFGQLTDQAGCFIVPDPGPNSLQRLSADDTIGGKKLISCDILHE